MDRKKKWPYPKCTNCGLMVIGSLRMCGRCGHPFTDKEIAVARKEAGKCPGCGCSPCRCDTVKEALEKDSGCGLVYIEDWQKYFPREDSMVIPGTQLEEPGSDVVLTTTNKKERKDNARHVPVK